MSQIIDNTHSQINEIDQQIKDNSAKTRQQIAEVNSNSDFTSSAKNQKIQVLERERDSKYKDLVQQKADVINTTRDKLSKRLYSGGEVSNPIAFDEAVNRFKNESEKELINRLNQNPSDETKRAIYKASVVSDNPKFKVLATASDLYEDDKSKIADYFDFQQQYGELEDRTQKLGRRLFGELA